MAKIKGKDICLRPIYDWTGSEVFHSTNKSSAKNIKKTGYKILENEEQSGYYGKAVSFTPDISYSKQFGEITTVGVLDDNIKILNLNDPADWSIYIDLINNKSPEKYYEAVLDAGFDGLYDAGAGDLFIFNPQKVKFLRMFEN